MKSLKLENLREALPRHPGVAWMRQVGCDLWCFILRFIGCCTSPNIIYFSYLYWLLPQYINRVGLYPQKAHTFEFRGMNSFVNHFQIVCQAFFQFFFPKSCRQITRLVRFFVQVLTGAVVRLKGSSSVQEEGILFNMLQWSLYDSWCMILSMLMRFFHSIYMMSIHYLWSFQ